MYHRYIYKKTLLLSILILLCLSFLFPIGNDNTRELEKDLEKAVDKDKVGILIRLVDVHRYQNPWDAMQYAVQALELLEEFPNPRQKVTILNHTCALHINVGQYDEARERCREALAISQANNDQQGEGNSLFNLGWVVLHDGHYRQALKYASKAREVYNNTNRQNDIARVNMLMGSIYWRLTEHASALDHALKAVKMYEKLGDQRGLPDTYNTLGIIYADIKYLDKSLEYLQKALDIYTQQGNLAGLSTCLNNIARIHSEQDRQDMALEYFKRSLKFKKALGDRHGSASTLNNIGVIYERKKNYKQAMAYYRRGFDIWKRIDERRGILLGNLNLGNLYFKTGRYPQALEHLRKGLAMSQKMNAPSEEAVAHQVLSDTYAAMNNHVQALEYYKSHHEVRDSIYNETRDRKIAELQARYDVEKKEKEIQLLRKDKQIRELKLLRQTALNHTVILVSSLILILAFVIYARYRLKVRVTRALEKEFDQHRETMRKLQRYREHLSELVDERTRELREAQEELIRRERLSTLGRLTATVAHEIRNPLGAVRTSVFTACDALTNEKIQRAQQALQLAERNIIRCDNIINELLEFTRRRELMPEPTPIDGWLAALLEEQLLPPDVICTRDFNTGVEIPVDRERLRQVFINVVNNALHAMEEQPLNQKELNVATRLVDNRLEIRFSDTGCGIPEEIQTRVFEPLFTTKHSGFGLGLSLVKNIMEQHNGGIEIESRPDEGTTVNLWLPK